MHLARQVHSIQNKSHSFTNSLWCNLKLVYWSFTTLPHHLRESLMLSWRFLTNFKFTNPHPTRGSTFPYLYKIWKLASNSLSSVPRLRLFYFAAMLPEVILQSLDSLASRAQPPLAGIFDEFEGKIPTAGGASFPMDTSSTRTCICICRLANQMC